MEVLAFLALLAGGVLATALALKVSFWILFAVALPLFWLWMLVDAIARRAEDYPSKSTNEKVLWIVLILIVHVSVVVYWFVVYLAARRRQAAAVAPAQPGPSALQAAIVPAPQPVAPTPPSAV